MLRSSVHAARVAAPLVLLAALTGSVESQNLNADVPTIPIDAGGSQVLSLGAGGGWGGFLYLIAGSVNGTTPGFVYDGFTIPLNLDAYTRFSIADPGTVLTNSFGFFDASGRATATFTLPTCSDPILAGLVGAHAFAVFDPLTLRMQGVSNAATVTLTVQDPMYVASCSLGCSSGFCGKPVTWTTSLVQASAPIDVDFSMDVDLSSVNLISFQVADLTSGTAPPGTFSLVGTRTLRFTPTGGLVPGNTYTVRVPGFTQDPGLLYVQSLAGDVNAATLFCTFLAQ